MRILDRYIARQILVSTLISVVVLSVVIVLGKIFQQLLDKLVEGQMTVGDILKFIGYAFPWSLSYTVPWGILTAVLLTFGRLSADNELISLRMSGLSLTRITLPVLGVAVLLSGLCFWINTTVAPASAAEIRRTTQEALLKSTDSLFKAGEVVQAEGLPFIMYAEKKDPETGVFRNVQMFQLQGGKGRPGSLTLAAEAKFNSSDVQKDKSIRMEFPGNNVIITRPEPLSSAELATLSPEEREQATTDAADADWLQNINFQSEISLKEFMDKKARIKVETMTMQELREGLENPATLAQKGYVLPTEPQKFRSHMLTEFNRRISFSLACVVLALIGIPFGITAQRRDTSSGFVLSLVVGIIYFTFIMVGELWKDSPKKLPHLWVWMPNIVFGTMGLFMFLRLQRR